MPVHFRGASEYKTHYQWLDSFKSKSFQPQPEQIMDPAGQPSVYSSVTMEPPLQHKKRIGGPPTSLSTDYFTAPSREPEYTLLGQQEKFAPNVQYQLKVSSSEQKVYKNKENFNDASPPSKQLKMQKRMKPLIKEHHPRISRSPPRQSARAVVSPPPAPRGHHDNLELKEALKDKDLKDVLEHKSSKPAPQEKLRSEQKEELSNMNEFVQTNLKKGVTLSAPEAPANYALKYKAGVAPPRPIQKVSEYQKQFQWKQGMKSSPLLAAEQIVYKSNAELGPYKSDAVPKLSEYNRQFQPWKPLSYEQDNLNINNNKNNNSITHDDVGGSKRKKPVIKRSKSAGAMQHKHDDFEHPEVQQDEFVDDYADQSSDKKETASVSEELKVKLKGKHGKMRHAASEYRSNYKAPTRYSYDKGVWKGAFPPHIMPQGNNGMDISQTENNNNNNNNNYKPPLSNWFAEVIELRRRAEEYRKRAQGTHFSREHLVQLMAKENDCWDLNSDTSSTIKALNLEAATLSRTRRNLERPQPHDSVPVSICSHEATEGDSPVMSDVDDTTDQQPKLDGKKKKGKKSGKIDEQKKKARKDRKMAWLEEQKEKLTEQKRKLEQQSNEEEQEEGRLPTPLLKLQASASSNVQRHHLDLTTPAVGGALLTCPPSKDNKIIITSRSGDSYVTASDDYPAKSLQKTYNMNQLLTAPVLGRPSDDTHPLRDDYADDDRPLKTQYVISPAMPDCEEDKENAGAQKKQSKRRSKISKPSNLTTVDEGYGKTYVGLDDVRKFKKDQDEDVMSVSLMSVASSGSLASQILERTKKRKEFWNNGDKAC